MKKIGIITLVGDNYGNKFQNYAVEVLMKQYGNVETFRIEQCNNFIVENERKITEKLKLSYIKQVLTSRLMYKYNINNTQRPLLSNLVYVLKNRKSIIKAQQERHNKFKNFNKKYLHISDVIISHNNMNDEWLKHYDYFVCGSDQIWNPGYTTTSDLAFLSFASREKCIALSPSFGVSEIPESLHNMYCDGINGIEMLSVREEAGKKIIFDLTGRNAEVLVDPTMAIDVSEWEKIATKPEIELPDKYLLCYFLGKVDNKYRTIIKKIAEKNNLEIVSLFDIEHTEYYSLDPSEVLYCIKNATMVTTDSFHGTVFSILFHKDFTVFERNEGGLSMSSRLETLLKRFGLQSKLCYSSLNTEVIDWDVVDKCIISARNDYYEYFKKCKLEKEEL